MTLFVGFFSHEKCPDLMFEAWSRATAADAGSVLVFVGATRSAYYEVDPRLADGIRERAAALGLIERLVFVEGTGEIEKYYRAADTFVLPSLREGLPTLLEALRAAGHGATRLEGVTDFLIGGGVGGILVPPLTQRRRRRSSLAAIPIARDGRPRP